MVLGINLDQGIKAYPLREVKRNGGVVEDMMGEHPIVVLAGPIPEDVTMAAYSRLLGERTLSFRHAADHFVDSETGTLWNIQGEAVDGPLAGEAAGLLSDLTMSAGTPGRTRILGASCTGVQNHWNPILLWPPGPASILRTSSLCWKGLSQLGREVRIEGPMVTLRLPHEVERGLRIRVGEDPLNLYLFQSAGAAEDYHGSGRSLDLYSPAPPLGAKMLQASG